MHNLKMIYNCNNVDAILLSHEDAARNSQSAKMRLAPLV
jgi:hypothetical protein